MNPAFLLILGSMLAGGYLTARLRVFPDNAADTLNRFVIYISLPAVVLLLVPKLRFSSDLFVLALTPWLMLGASLLLVWAAARRLRFSREVLASLLLCVPLGNTSFLGFPVLTALLGPESVRLALLYDQLGSFLIVSTYGLFVLARFSGGEKPTARIIAARVLKFPPFLSLLFALGLALFGITPPAPVQALLTRIGDTLVPLAMFAVGLKLKLRPPKERAALAFGLCTKMLLLPALAFILVRALGTPVLPARVAVLEAAMPPMITAGAMAILAGFAPELTAALVGYGILLSLLTLPAIAALLRLV
jgi:predicted permease